jgi:hypothetical protein
MQKSLAQFTMNQYKNTSLYFNKHQVCAGNASCIYFQCAARAASLLVLKVVDITLLALTFAVVVAWRTIAGTQTQCSFRIAVH